MRFSFESSTSATIKSKKSYTIDACAPDERQFGMNSKNALSGKPALSSSFTNFVYAFQPMTALPGSRHQRNFSALMRIHASVFRMIFFATCSSTGIPRWKTLLRKFFKSTSWCAGRNGSMSIGAFVPFFLISDVMRCTRSLMCFRSNVMSYCFSSRYCSSVFRLYVLLNSCSVSGATPGLYMNDSFATSSPFIGTESETMNDGIAGSVFLGPDIRLGDTSGSSTMVRMIHPIVSPAKLLRNTRETFPPLSMLMSDKIRPRMATPKRQFATHELSTTAKKGRATPEAFRSRDSTLCRAATDVRQPLLSPFEAVRAGRTGRPTGSGTKIVMVKLYGRDANREDRYKR